MSNRSKSKNWYNRHNQDYYVRSSRLQGLRSRSSYKLLDIHKNEKLFFPDSKVIDLGSCPGGWSQVVKKYVNNFVVAVDLNYMQPIDGVHFIQSDFLDQKTHKLIGDVVESRGVDVILSDMSPNLTGISCVDQENMLSLADSVISLADVFLKQTGKVLIKMFAGSCFNSYINKLKQMFMHVKVIKPNSSRACSKEVYVLASSL